MKFYSLNFELWNPTEPSGKTYPKLRGDTIKEGRNLFIEKKIYMENYVENAPIFDYFTMVEGGYYKKEDDWILLDMHSFIGYKVPIQINGFAVSLKFKQVLEGFLIETPYRFYPCKIKYKGEKIDYFIFQVATNIFDKISFDKSSYSTRTYEEPKVKNINYKIKSQATFFNCMLEESKDKRDLFISNGVIQNYYDFFNFYSAGHIISERLKNAIEDAGITGVEIKPIENITFEFESGVPPELK